VGSKYDHMTEYYIYIDYIISNTMRIRRDESSSSIYAGWMELDGTLKINSLDRTTNHDRLSPMG
jgi:hypothetical protein